MRNFLILCTAAVLAHGTILADSTYTLTVEDKPVPDAIDAEIRDQIEPKSYTLSDSEGAFFEFWFAKTLDEAKQECRAT